MGSYAKSEVKRQRPDAHAWSSWMDGKWYVNESTKDGNPELGTGNTEDEAWIMAVNTLLYTPFNT